MIATMADKVGDTVDELLSYLLPSERRELDEHVARIRPKAKGVPAPKRWADRVRTLFPRFASKPFASRHTQLWEWANAIEVDSAPDPFCGFWPRGGAKSTSAEMLVTDLGARGKRKYCLYVRMTQPQADKSIGNIATLLESEEVRRHYPEHADRKVGRFGNSKGWRREQLRTAGGFTVDALGLDAASRGAKVDENRPDLIVFDDIDDMLDSPATTKKKRDIITHTILPAGSDNVAVLFIQNLIIPDGVASQLADGRADFLIDRIVSGPFPAIEGFTYEWRADPTTGVRRAIITGGKPTWEGQDLAACQKFINRWGLSAFLKEAQHKVKGRPEGVALRFDARRHYVDMTDDQVRDAIKAGAVVFAGVDFGAWRFAFTLWMVDRNRVVTRIDELFSQPLTATERAQLNEDALPKNSLQQRARLIHEMCAHYGIVDRMIPIWGDAANPQDILQINLVFRDGWDVEDPAGRVVEHVKSKLRVLAVMNENKSRKTGVEKINNALDHNTLRYRRGIKYEWRLGMNAASEGTPQTSSRLMWEIDNWSFPVPKEGQAQDQNPDDHTADGGDMVAAKRYALMSHWGKSKLPPDFGTYENDRAHPFDYKERKFKEPAHAIDVIQGGQAKRVAPRVSMPRPRGIR